MLNEEERRKRRRKWLSGSLALLVLAAAGGGRAVLRIPADIAARTAAALQIAGLDPRTAVSVEGRTVTLSGEVANPYARARMRAIAGSIRGVRTVIDHLSVAPLPPAEFAARPSPPEAVFKALAPPSEPASKPLEPPPGQLQLPLLHFEFASTRLTPDSELRLAEIIAELDKYPDGRIEVAGHADAIGSKSYNQELSLRRARAVAGRLVAAGIDAARLQTRGYRESRPLTDNHTRQGRAMNRRVELTRIQ
jgi:outer membrane protein OmpA-like peptidoglycan-associated protein